MTKRSSSSNSFAMNSKYQLLVSFLLAASSIITFPSISDEYHHNNLLIGKNAVGLGGAFTGVADDLSAIHYNPAGLASIADGNMASINTFAWEETVFEGVYGDGSDFTRSAFSVVPGFFGFKKQINNWHYGLAFVVNDFSQERSSDVIEYNRLDPATGLPANVSEFINIDIDNSAYQLYFAAAKQINEQLSLGLSLGIEYRTFQTDQSSGTQIALPISLTEVINTGGQATARFNDVNVVAAPSISIIYKSDETSVGAKLNIPTVVNRDYEMVASAFFAGVDPRIPGVNPAYLVTEEACCKQELPMSLAIGFAKKWGDWELSTDVQHHLSTNEGVERLNGFPVPITRDFVSVTNYALGVSKTLSADSQFRLGIFTDKSNIKIDPEIDFQRVEDVDLLGVSASIDTKLFDMPVTFGGYAKFGSGKVRVSDVRAVEQTTGIALYPTNNEFDISNMEKRVLLFFFSLNF
jgi:hypothetical protein